MAGPTDRTGKLDDGADAGGTSKLWRIDAVGAAVCLAAMAVVMLLVVMPLMRQRQAHAANQAELAARRGDLQKLSSELTTLQSRLAEVQKSLEACPLRLQSARDINRRLARLSQLATTAGLKVDTVEPGQLAVGPRYDAVPIRLGGAGNYRTAAGFLHLLRSEFPDMGVAAMDLSAGSGGKSGARFQLDLLWFIGREAVPQQASVTVE